MSHIISSCPVCGWRHPSDAARAIGLFRPGGVLGYRSELGGPLRATREEAVSDWCRVTAIRNHRDPGGAA